MPAEAAMPAARLAFKPSFFFWMTLAMCLFVFGGFGMHSFWPSLRGDFPPAPPVVHLHALLFVTWMLLLVAQSALVCAGNVKLHRSLGLWGVAHGAVVITMGLMMQLIASGAGYFAGRPPGTDGLYLGLLAFAGFAVMFPIAIRNRNRPQVHKRMVLFAMLPVIPPGVNRFWSNALGLDDPIPTFWLYLTLWSMAAAILVQEKRSTGKIAGISLFAAGWIFVEGAVHEVVVGSAWFNQVGGAILSLVHYR